MSKDIKTKFSTLYVLPEVMKKIIYYTQAADGEVSGLGTIMKDGEKRLIVDKVFLLEQESSAGDTELDSEAISKLLTDMIMAKEDPGRVKFWWHSHGNMGVFWSGQDDECAEKLSKEYAFSLVVNKDNELRCRLDLYNPFRITVDGIKVREMTEDDEFLKKACKEEVEKKVRSTTPYYQTRNWKERDNYGPFFPKDESFWGKTDLKENEVKDVIRLLDIVEDNITLGGQFYMETWNEYIRDTLREVTKTKYKKKAECTEFGTWGEDYAACKRCKIAKTCKEHTEYWEKEDEIENERKEPDISEEEARAEKELRGEEDFSRKELEKEGKK